MFEALFAGAIRSDIDAPWELPVVTPDPYTVPPVADAKSAYARRASPRNCAGSPSGTA